MRADTELGVGLAAHGPTSVPDAQAESATCAAPSVSDPVTDGAFVLTIVITGASGHLGRAVAERLLTDHGVTAGDLVLVTRSPDKLTDVAARGAQVRQGDFADPPSLELAFAGADKALIISTDVVGTDRKSVV